MLGGKLYVTAMGDGIECEDGFILINGGEITCVSSVDDTRGITCDSTLILTGGTVDVTVSGKGSKGIRANQMMILSGGVIEINTSGGLVLNATGSGFDPAYCTGIKGEEDILFAGGTVTINGTGTASKGISADGSISMSSGQVTLTSGGNGATYRNSSGVTDSYNATAMTADDGISLTGGTLAITASGAGGKGMTTGGAITIGDSATNSLLNVMTTGSKFIVSGSGMNADYNEPKAVKAGGAISIQGGEVSISSNDDGLKSTTSVTIGGGVLNVSKSYEAFESPVITVNGGKVSLVANTFFHIQDAGGNDVLTFRPLRRYASVVFSSPLLKKGGTYSIFTGGSTTGTDDKGLYSGGSYSGGTLKKTFTISGKVTNVTF